MSTVDMLTRKKFLPVDFAPYTAVQAGIGVVTDQHQLTSPDAARNPLTYKVKKNPCVLEYDLHIRIHRYSRFLHPPAD